MINNLLKISALIVTGRFLKPRIKGLVVLILFWLIVSFLHDEYIKYVELSGNSDYLLQITLLKIGLYLLGFLAYLFFIERRLLIASTPEKPFPVDQESVTKPATNQSNDGFDFLRSKKKLETSEEKLLK